MPLTPQPLTPTFATSRQVQVPEVAEAKALGFQSLINNRPDGEEEGQPTAAQVQAAAEAAGLGYVHIPISGPPTPAQILATQAALATLPGPILAFCKSGGRSKLIFTLSTTLATGA